MFRKAWVVALSLLAGGVALAGGNTDAMHEASVGVTGTIDIDAAGAVTGYAIDRRQKLDSAVANLIDRAIPTWKFEPKSVDAGSKAGHTRMSLMIVARQQSANQYAMRIQSAHFTDTDASPSDSITSASMRPPAYPTIAARMGVEGTVYVALKIDRTGHVTDAMAEQVNVGGADSPSAMEQGRRVLTEVTLKAARNWTFHPPTTGKSAGDPYWLGQVPVQYSIGIGHDDGYGRWQVYVPGPKQPIPWVDPQNREATANPEALIPGELSTAGNQRRLLTALETQ
jgi:TonB family protein